MLRLRRNKLFLGEKIHERTPFIIIGSLAIFGALFTIAFLPETKGVTLPETVDDILANNRLAVVI